MEYQVVEAEYLVEIQDEVNKEIRKGWTLQGGVAYNSNMGYYMQAMIRNKYSYDNVNSLRASPNPDSELKPVIASSGVAGGGGAILKPVIASSGVAGGGGGGGEAVLNYPSDPNPGKDSSKPQWVKGLNWKGIVGNPVSSAALARLTGMPARPLHARAAPARAVPARAAPAQAVPAQAVPARDSISDDEDIKSFESDSDGSQGGGSNKRKQKTKRSRMMKKRRTLRK
jgi:hypothetical protein